jgi:hypothetical protein
MTVSGLAYRQIFMRMQIAHGFRNEVAECSWARKKYWWKCYGSCEGKSSAI